jgi:hypothetical protein
MKKRNKKFSSKKQRDPLAVRQRAGAVPANREERRAALKEAKLKKEGRKNV